MGYLSWRSGKTMYGMLRMILNRGACIQKPSYLTMPSSLFLTSFFHWQQWLTLHVWQRMPYCVVTRRACSMLCSTSQSIWKTWKLMSRSDQHERGSKKWLKQRQRWKDPASDGYWIVGRCQSLWHASHTWKVDWHCYRDKTLWMDYKMDGTDPIDTPWSVPLVKTMSLTYTSDAPIKTY